MKLNAVFLTLLWSSVLWASYREKYINGCIDTQQYTSIHRYIENMLYSFLWLKDERISDWVNLPILWFMCSYSHLFSSRTVIIFLTAMDWICQSAQVFLPACLPLSGSGNKHSPPLPVQLLLWSKMDSWIQDLIHSIPQLVLATSV